MRKKQYLKGCPFCGKDKLEEQRDCMCVFYIRCTNCGGKGPVIYTRQEARRLWNERVRSD